MPSGRAPGDSWLTPGRVYTAVLWLAFLWALGNALIVYLFLRGAGVHRVESAVLFLVVLMLPRVLRGTQPAPARDDGKGPPPALLALVPLGLWAATYLPLLRFPFLTDDFVFLSLYRDAANIGRAAQFFRPLFAAVFWALRSLGGGSPVSFHAASFVLHLASAYCVFRLGVRFLGSAQAALVGFTVFLLNPLQLEAVLWVSGLQELLWTLFVLAALLCYTRTRRLGMGHLAGTIALAWCALMAKETAVCYVLLLPAADLALYRMDRGRLLRWAYPLFLGELAAYLALRSRAVTLESAYFVAPSRYFVKQLVLTPYRFFVHPWNASAVDVPAWVLALTGVFALSLAFLAVVRGRASRRLLAGPVMVLASTLPVYSYFFVSSDLASSRYIYFAAAGWAILVAGLLHAFPLKRLAFVALVVALSGAGVVSLQLNLRPWRVAGDVVGALEAGISRGESAGEVLTVWQKTRGIRLLLTDGIPRTYQGVGIFVNGYPEFLHSVERPDPPGRR